MIDHRCPSTFFLDSSLVSKGLSIEVYKLNDIS
jgi:hypothetical protein